MVLAYHIIFTAYGFWLPNDPRGSWSDFVWAWELRRFGPATKVTTSKSLATIPHDASLPQAAKKSLLHPPVLFTGTQARAIARGFADATSAGEYRLFACSIMTDHVHAVVARHPHRTIEMIANHLKARATTFLIEEKLHPFQNEADTRGKRHTPWTESFWQVYLDTSHDIDRAIKYVENNPIKEGCRAQHWNFITPRLAPAFGPENSDAPITKPRPKGRG